MENQTSDLGELGELEELVQAMTPAQRLRFKQAVVQQAIHFVAQCLPPEDQDEGHRDGILAASSWLNEPTEEKAQAATLFAASSCWDGGVRYHDYPASFLAPAWVVGEGNVCKAAEHAAQTAPLEEQALARQWQVVSAWAIAHGEEPPPLL